jgi:hypothetical protein
MRAFHCNALEMPKASIECSSGYIRRLYYKIKWKYYLLLPALFHQKIYAEEASDIVLLPSTLIL